MVINASRRRLAFLVFASISTMSASQDHQAKQQRQIGDRSEK
jgi:hypothetical protein